MAGENQARVVTVRMTEALKKRLDDASVRLDKPINTICCEAIQYSLDKYYGAVPLAPTKNEQEHG